MELKGAEPGGQITLHSNDATFVGVDTTADELSDNVDENEHVFYTGLVLAKPEVFVDLPQWKDTVSPEQRIEILEMILALVRDGNELPLICFQLCMKKAYAYKLGCDGVGKLLMDNPDKAEPVLKHGDIVVYRFDDTEFGELQAVSMMTYANVLTALGVIVMKVLARKVFETQQKPIIQFLIDNVSGNAENNKELIKYLIENTELAGLLGITIKNSSFVEKWGVEVARTNKILDGDVIEDTNEIPLMIATDWFTKIGSRYHELDPESEDLDEDDALIVEIIKTLEKKSGYLVTELPKDMKRATAVR